MATPQEISEILARTDIVDLIGSDIELKKAGKDFTALCPFHTEKTPSFTVVPGENFYHCFGCGSNGDALSWMREYHRLPFPQAIEELAKNAGITIGKTDQGERRERKSKQATNEIEAALYHELLVLEMTLGERVTFRAIPPHVIKKYQHIQQVPNDPAEREYEAAKRIAKGLYALYGARA